MKMFSKKSLAKKKMTGSPEDLELKKRKSDELGEDLGAEEWTEEEKEIEGEDTED